MVGDGTGDGLAVGGGLGEAVGAGVAVGVGLAEGEALPLGEGVVTARKLQARAISDTASTSATWRNRPGTLLLKRFLQATEPQPAG
jgi:hypothetical protein